MEKLEKHIEVILEKWMNSPEELWQHIQLLRQLQSILAVQ